MSNIDIDNLSKELIFTRSELEHPVPKKSNGKSGKNGDGNLQVEIVKYQDECEKFLKAGDQNLNDLLKKSNRLINLLDEKNQVRTEDLEQYYIDKIDKLQQYIKEIEKTSMLIGRQNLVLSYFYQAGQMLSSTLDSGRLISTIVEMLTNIFDRCLCVLITLDDNDNLRAFEIDQPCSGFARYFNDKVKMKLGQGCEGECVNEQIPCQIYDVYTDRRYKPFAYLADIFNFQSVLSVPLTIRGQIEGCITIYSLEKRFFSEEDIRILTMFSDQAAIAIENARLYQKTDEKMNARIQELSLMHRIEHAIINNAKLNDILKIFLGGLEELFNGFGYLMDLTRVESGLMISNQTFEISGVEKKTVLALTEEVVKKGVGLEKEMYINSKIVNLFGLPIFLQKDVVGSFWIVGNGDTRANSEMIEYARWVLDQISVAIEKSKTLEQLIHAEKMNLLGSLLSGITHELNNPLSRILGLTEIAEEETDLKVIRKYIEIVKEEAIRSKGIMDDFLAFARKYKSNESIADINTVINNTLQLWNYQKKTHDMKITTKFNENLPKVKININRIQQVFLNLIVNAYHAVSSSDKKNKTLWIETSLHKDKIKIIVRDNGSGVDEENLGKIFMPFFTTKEKGKGTGLGLSLSRDIIREHKGELWAEDTQGKGAKFILELPITRDLVMLKTKEPRVKNQKVVANANILVAEDDQIILKLISTFLKREGYKVTMVQNGSECLKNVREKHYDLVVLDMIMPDIRGDQAIRIIEKENKVILKSIILCTGDILEQEKLKDFESKGVRVLYKPFELVELKETIEEVLNSNASNLSVT